MESERRLGIRLATMDTVRDHLYVYPSFGVHRYTLVGYS
jgi:hypothetical protein